jgi:elongator complex protein 1
MYSHKLSIPSGKIPAGSPSHSLRIPVHASFSSTQDILAVLWESGHAELWDLHTRIAPGRGEVMAPTLIWNGEITTFTSPRQIAVITCGQSTSDGELTTIIVLGSESSKCDAVTVVELGGDLSKKSYDVKMPYQNGRLISSDGAVVLQSPDGQIFESESTDEYDIH